MSNIIKGSIVTVTVAALLTGTTAWAVCTPDDTSKQGVVQEVSTEGTDCMVSNLTAKAGYWADVLSGQNTVADLTIEEREDQVAADMENAAQNLRDGSYRVCWGE
jgi:predicted small integral membrane protein